MNKWLIMFSVGLMLVLVNLDMTIIYLALATITKELQTTMVKAQWVINSYVMATVALFTLFGRLADNFGRKRIFLVGVFIFTAASLWCGLSTGINELIVARLVQGIGFAASLGLALVICSSAFPPNERGFAIGMAVTISGVAQAVGPTVGGFIVQYCDWQWVFLLNVPVGIVSFIASYLFIPKDSDDRERLPINGVSVVLFISSITLLSYALNELPNLSFIHFVMLMLLAAVILVGFVMRSLRVDYPLIDVRLLIHKAYLMVVTVRMLTMYFMATWLFILPMLMQNVLGMSPLKTGLVMFFMSLFVAIIAPLIGKILDAYGFRQPLFWASLSGLLSALLLAVTPAHFHSYWWLSGVMVFYGICLGLHLPSSTHGALKQAPEDSHGSATGLFFTAAIGGSLIGVAISGAILNFVSRINLMHFLSALDHPVSAAQLAALRQVANASRNLDWFLANHDLPREEVAYLASHASFYSALHLVAWVTGALMLLATVLTLKLKGRCVEK